MDLFLKLVSVAITGQLFAWLYFHLSSPLRSVRGPFLARFTDTWYLWSIGKGNFEELNLVLHKEYGIDPVKWQFHVSLPF
jgi:hypothetical protein